MANGKEVIAEETLQSTAQVELNMDQKIVIKSIAGWATGFGRIESYGDVFIPPEGTARVSRSEVIAQAQSGNRLLTGVDGEGSHATLYIDDEPTRIELGFESKEYKKTQKILTVDAVKKLFEYKTVKTFEEKLKEIIVTRAEKYAIIQIIKKEKINDFEKVRIVENYTGFKVR